MNLCPLFSPLMKVADTRHHAWRSIANPLPVETMERDEAIDFLVKRTNRNDHITADKLADALGDLPLALEQAGAFIEERRVSLTTCGARRIAETAAHLVDCVIPHAQRGQRRASWSRGRSQDGRLIDERTNALTRLTSTGERVGA